MAILLIFGLITVGICAVSAEDVSDDGAVTEEVDDSAADAPLVATSTDDSTEDSNQDSNGKSVDDTASADDGEISEEDNEVTTGESTTGQLMPDENYEALFNQLVNLDDYTYDAIMDTLYDLNDPAFNELVYAFDTGMDSEIIIQMLKDLDMEHLITLLRICNDMEGSSGYNYIVPAQVNPVKTAPTTSNVKNVVTGNGTATVTNDGTTSFSTKNPVYKQAKTAYPVYNYGEYISDYEIYQYYLDLYLNGRITFDELKIYLENEGINTDDLVLNEDGSVSFFGQTSPVPITSKDAVDEIPDNTDNAADATPDDDANAVDDTTATDDTESADSTDSTDTVGDAEDIATADSGDESTSDDSVEQ